PAIPSLLKKACIRCSVSFRTDHGPVPSMDQRSPARRRDSTPRLQIDATLSPGSHTPQGWIILSCQSCSSCLTRCQEDTVAALTGRVAAFYGPGQPMVINEYPVPDPAPGAIVVKTTLANICGSDLHQWRGEFDVAKFGRPYPQILGHEMTGRVHV